jgi:large subunit ribosomal protein L25
MGAAECSDVVLLNPFRGMERNEKVLVAFRLRDAWYQNFSLHPYARNPHPFSVMRQETLPILSRSGIGRNAAKRERTAGRVPGVIYSRHGAPEAVSVDYPAMKKLLVSVGSAAALVELKHGEKSRLSIIKEVQKDPLTDKITHVDFQEVRQDEKIEVNVAVSLVGECYGVKNESGILDITSQQLRIRCLPKDIPSYIEVDVTELRVGQNLHVGEIKAPAGVEFLTPKSQSVVACTEAVAEIASTSSAPAAAAAAPKGAAAPAAAAATPAKGAAPAAPAKK